MPKNSKSEPVVATPKAPTFAERLAAEHGFDPAHPKVIVLFRLAWEMGHSAGESEVDIYYDMMSELLKP